MMRIINGELMDHNGELMDHKPSPAGTTVGCLTFRTAKLFLDNDRAEPKVEKVSGVKDGVTGENTNKLEEET